MPENQGQISTEKKRGKTQGFKLTPHALKDLRDIARYTEIQWGRRQRTQYLIELDQRFQWLSVNPDLAMNRDEVKLGYLSYPQGKHIIFFRKTRNQIEILSILHRNMDVKRHL